MIKRFTLIEMLVGLAILGLLFGGIYMFMSQSAKDSSVLTSKIDIQIKARNALMAMEKLIHNSERISGAPGCEKSYDVDASQTVTSLFLENKYDDNFEGELKFENNKIIFKDKIILDNVVDCSFLVRSKYLVDYKILMKIPKKSASADEEYEETIVYSSVFLANNKIFSIHNSKDGLSGIAQWGNQSKLKQIGVEAVSSEEGGKVINLHFKIPAWVDWTQGKISFDIVGNGQVWLTLGRETKTQSNNSNDNDSNDEESGDSLMIEKVNTDCYVKGRFFFDYKIGEVNSQNPNGYPLKLFNCSNMSIEWDGADLGKTIIYGDNTERIKADFRIPSQTYGTVDLNAAQKPLFFVISVLDCEIKNFQMLFDIIPPNIAKTVN